MKTVLFLAEFKAGVQRVVLSDKPLEKPVRVGAWHADEPAFGNADLALELRIDARSYRTRIQIKVQKLFAVCNGGNSEDRAVKVAVDAFVVEQKRDRPVQLWVLANFVFDVQMKLRRCARGSEAGVRG
jgi:hypothetical protein